MVYVAIHGIEYDEKIIGIYYNKDHARKAILNYIENYDFCTIKQINEDRYEFSVRYVEVREYEVQ